MQTIAKLDSPLFVKWYITSRCNLRCTHCYLTDYTINPPLARILPLIAQLQHIGVRHVSLLGGEPLARDDLEIIVAAITSGGMRLRIATNGILASITRARSLMAAGARDFQVSIEGHEAADNNAIRGKDTFPAIMQGVEALSEAGANVALAVTLTRRNSQHLAALFHLARSCRSSLRLNAYMPVGTGASLAEDLLLTPADITDIRTQVARERANFPDVQIEPGLFHRRIPIHAPKKRPASTFGCGAGTNTLIINSDFTLSACDLLVEKDRSTARLQTSDDLLHMWRSDPVFKKWRGEDSASQVAHMTSFVEVHQHGCHLAHSTYGAALR